MTPRPSPLSGQNRGGASKWKSGRPSGQGMGDGDREEDNGRCRKSVAHAEPLRGAFSTWPGVTRPWRRRTRDLWIPSPVFPYDGAVMAAAHGSLRRPITFIAGEEKTVSAGDNPAARSLSPAQAHPQAGGTGASEEMQRWRRRRRDRTQSP